MTREEEEDDQHDLSDRASLAEQLKEIGLDVAGPSRLLRPLHHQCNGGQIRRVQTALRLRIGFMPRDFRRPGYPIGLPRRWDSAVRNQRNTGMEGLSNI